MAHIRKIKFMLKQIKSENRRAVLMMKGDPNNKSQWFSIEISFDYRDALTVHAICKNIVEHCAKEYQTTVLYNPANTVSIANRLFKKGLVDEDLKRTVSPQEWATSADPEWTHLFAKEELLDGLPKHRVELIEKWNQRRDDFAKKVGVEPLE